MKKFDPPFLCLFPALFISISIISLSGQVDQTLQQIKNHLEVTADAIEDISYPAKGNKNHNFYINKSWQNSFVITQSNEIFYFNGRYNVLNKNIEYSKAGKQRIIYPKRIKAAMIGEKVLIPIGAQQVQQVDNNRFLEVLSSGAITLLNSYIMDSRLETGSSISFEGTGKKIYFVDEVLYYTHDFITMHKLPNAKHKILNLFKDNRKQVEDFAKKERLRFNEKKDLGKIFDYYNALF